MPLALRRGHANLLCIVPILVYVKPKLAHLIVDPFVTNTFEPRHVSTLRAFVVLILQERMRFKGIFAEIFILFLVFRKFLCKNREFSR